MCACYAVYGTQSGSYDGSMDAGNATSCTLPDLDDGLVYYASVKAYNTFEMFSEERSGTDLDGTGSDRPVHRRRGADCSYRKRERPGRGYR